MFSAAAALRRQPPRSFVVDEPPACASGNHTAAAESHRDRVQQRPRRPSVAANRPQSASLSHRDRGATIGRRLIRLTEWTNCSTATRWLPSLCCSAGIATASRSDRLRARRSPANSAPLGPLAQRSVRGDSANVRPLSPWTSSSAYARLLLPSRAAVREGAGARVRSRSWLQSEASASVHHRGAPCVDSGDDLFGVDPLEVGAGR